MDLSKLNTKSASNTPRTLKLRNPFTKELIKDGDKYLEINLLGIGSDAAKNASAEQSRAKTDDMTEDQKAKIGAEFLAKLTTGWSDNFELGDEKLKFNYENAVKLYLSEDWIGTQVLQFVTNLKNYDPNA